MDFRDLISWDIWTRTVKSPIDIEIIIEQPTRCAEPLNRGKSVPFTVFGVIDLKTEFLVDGVCSSSDDE